jgi:hypothetical protein
MRLLRFALRYASAGLIQLGAIMWCSTPPQVWYLGPADENPTDPDDGPHAYVPGAPLTAHEQEVWAQVVRSI